MKIECELPHRDFFVYQQFTIGKQIYVKAGRKLLCFSEGKLELLKEEDPCTYYQFADLIYKLVWEGVRIVIRKVHNATEIEICDIPKDIEDFCFCQGGLFMYKSTKSDRFFIFDMILGIGHVFENLK